MPLRATGQSGRILVGWREAVRLADWTIEGQGESLALRYTVAAADPFWSTQPATVVELNVGRVRWRWLVQGLDGRAGSVTLHGTPEQL